MLLMGLPRTKFCPCCQEERPLDAFGLNRASRTGRQSYCLRCRADMARQRRALGLDLNGNRHSRDRDQAHQAVARAVKSGTFHRPARCAKCGLGRQLEAHHYRGYERRFWLTVEWLCRSCHRIAHTRAVPDRIRRAA